MTDPIVTHADLTAINVLVGVAEGEGLPTGVCDLLERLRAAAEADAPDLREGWVLLDDGSGARRVLWHRDGVLYLWDDGTGVGYSSVGSPGCPRDRLTPLRPTITDPDIVEKVAYAIFREHDKIGARYEGTAREVSLNAAQAVLRVLDIGEYETVVESIQRLDG